MKTQKDVLIVGAGPVGLAGAVALARAGSRIRIVDKLPKAINQSRAAIVHARTMEHFERLGIVDDFLKAGVKIHSVALYGTRNELLIHPSFDAIPSPYPFMLGLEQFHTEALLTARLREAGVEIERGVEFLGFEDRGESVSARLRLADGTEETSEFAYLVGTDGARSAVRGGLGFHLEGETIDAHWVTIDVKIRWDRDPGEIVAYMSEHGLAFIAAMNDDRWRVILTLPGLTAEEAEKITVDDVQRIICEKFGVEIAFYDPVWVSVFGINTRMAPAMSRGRVFLCGDAAHVHSPVGGQGMNTGIQDALNLAWKLSMVLDGTARPELLDSFNAERHYNAKRLLGRIGPATKMANLRRPVVIEIRNHVIHLLGQLGIGHIMPQVAGMLDMGYPESPAVSESHESWFHRGPRAGERAPNAAGLSLSGHEEPQNLFTVWAGDGRHQLIVFGEDQPYPASPLYVVTRIVREGTPAPGLAVDTAGHAHHIYAAERTSPCYLVRPDGIIAWRNNQADPAALAAYLQTWFLAGA